MDMEQRQKAILQQMREDAGRNGYHLCPEQDMLQDLIAGLAANEERYGYGSCPCRLASGVRTNDSDIICPCEYRDVDCNELGTCYCGLFVSREVSENPEKLGSIPERRPQEIVDAAMEAKRELEREAETGGEAETGAKPSTRADAGGGGTARAGERSAEPPGKETAARRTGKPAAGATLSSRVPVWRCEVCGYLAARDSPPPVCPICKAKANRFERFDLDVVHG